MSELKETQEMKIVQLYELIPKQFMNPTPTAKIAHYGPKKSKMTPKLSQNQKVKLKKKTQKIKIQEQAQKHFFEPYPNPKNSLFFSPQSQKKIIHKLDKTKSKN